ncbi:hypothetical protein D3C71_1527860 [compost metagenome]
MPAVMAAQVVAARMIGQRNIAIGTPGDITAAAAHDKGREAPAVQQQHRLFSAVQPFLKRGMQLPAEHGTVALLQLFAHVHDFNSRQLIAQCTARHFQQARREAVITLRTRRIVALKRRCSGAKDDNGVTLGSPPYRYITSMISRILFLFVRRLMFLVHYN